MIPNIKKCRNLATDRFGHQYCKSTHICYRAICVSDMYATCFYHRGEIVTITSEQISKIQ